MPNLYEVGLANTTGSSESSTNHVCLPRYTVAARQHPEFTEGIELHVMNPSTVGRIRPS